MNDAPTFKLPGAGLKCGNCNAALPRVFRTKQSRGFISRERICQNCGDVNTTTERVVGTRERRRFSD